MTTKMPFLATALTLALAGQSTALFEFRPDEFWLNLHKFLYVLGRAQNRTADAMREPVADAPSDSDRGIESLTPAERNAWNDAITGYARGLSRQDSTRDTNLALLEGRLAGAGGSSTLNVTVAGTNDAPTSQSPVPTGQTFDQNTGLTLTATMALSKSPWLPR